MAASGVNIVSAGAQIDTQSFFSGEVDFVTLSWAYRFSGERISANGSNVPLYDWYVPAGATAFASGTALGGSAMWMKMSATAAPNFTGRVSARVTTTSAKILTQHFDIRIWTGQ
jgi:hypothetical protein